MRTFKKAGKLLITSFFCSAILNAQNNGVFEAHSDVGAVQHPGSLTYNASTGEYKLAGSGENIWFSKDEFHFAWKRMKGDFILQARGKFLGAGHDPHRKFGWMIRTGMDSNSAMACLAVHGDGLTSLQYRRQSKTNIEEIRSSVQAPDIIQLERKGNQFIMSVAHDGQAFVREQVSNIELRDEVYAGLFVCAHNKNVIESASFDNVRFVVPAKENFVAYREYLGSSIETLDIATGVRHIIYTSPLSLQAPNWMHNGKSLIYNSGGLMYNLNFSSPLPQVINTGDVKNNNNDHVISFNGKMLGLSSSSPDRKYNSVVYTVDINGGIPKQVTPTGPSYLHGWSPDGKYVIYTGQRNNEFDIYKMPVNGGEEIRLTTAVGLDDGSEYDPSGKYIYFNSVRSGTMQLWRMNEDGREQVQLTDDEYNNWFPHISPDGKWIVFLSFMKDVKPDDHPFYKHVYLRLMPVSGGQPKIIAYLYGGQGTINTPSWSPDSRKIAFVSNSTVIN
ncbi:MAG: Periplasmic component of the Tol biopolymer transport system-like protein [Chitinophagaceae bacterium]|nr:Periplasmic component of the Tol biopolymer transport system-like protein [Chitinophagaceae bacterium]